MEILERGRREREIAGMGTTLNCIMFVGEKMHLAHVGDSRTYLYYKKHLFQLTLDHSVGNFLERGWLPRVLCSQVLKTVRWCAPWAWRPMRCGYI